MENLLDAIDFKDMVEVNSGLDLEVPADPGTSDEPKKPVETPTDLEDKINFEDLQQQSEEEPVEKKHTDTPPPKGNKTSSNVPFALVFKSLVEEEAFSAFDEDKFSEDLEKEGPAVAIQNVFIKELEANRNELLAQADEDYKEYVALKDAGVDTETAKKLMLSKMQFDNLKEDDVLGEDKLEVRKQVLTQKYKLTTRLSEKEIDRLVNRAISSGDDEEEAAEALATIKEVNKQNIEAEKAKIKSAEEDKKKQQEAVAAKYKETIQKMDEPLPGMKINRQTKEKIEKMIFSGDIWKAREKDPQKFDTTLAFLVLNGAFEGKFTLAQQQAKTSKLKELEAHLQGYNKPAEYKSVQHTDISSEDDSEDLLKIMRSKKRSAI